MEENDTHSSFRDRPINIDESGKRKWIYARQPKGKWYTRRSVFAYACLAFLILAPIIKVNGNPFMLFDIANRKFSLFGNIIWAQDNYILALLMSVTVVFIVLFTVVFGRLWCGWACPQTVFLEMVFRRIEYLFDGNYRHAKNQVKPSFHLAFKRIAKHTVFILTSVFFTNVILMWFVGPDRLKTIVLDPISSHNGGFFFMIGVSLFYYWIYAFFREQVCTFACPYGRMQGVLLDSKTISVIYDFKR
jgi:cytochrome c oxidase accessory protein FixG